EEVEPPLSVLAAGDRIGADDRLAAIRHLCNLMGMREIAHPFVAPKVDPRPHPEERRRRVSKDDPESFTARAGTGPSFETPASRAPQNEGAAWPQALSRVSAASTTASGVIPKCWKT